MCITKEFIEKKYEIDKNCSFETWFMGTNEFDIWKKIILSINSQKNTNNWDSILNSNSICMSKVGNNRYEFKIGNFNILSNRISRQTRIFLARSTLHQYIDFGIALRFINEETSKNGQLNYALYPNFIKFIDNVDQENLTNIFLEKILILLKKYFYSNNKKVRSIGCSISWGIIYKYCEDNNRELQDIVKAKIIDLKKRDNRGNGMVQFIGSYKSVVKQLIDKFGYDNLIKIIESNLYSMERCTNEEFYDDNLKKIISSYRSKLRLEIIKSRVGIDKKWYTDFKEHFQERYINDLEACHIKEVAQIEDQLSKDDLCDEIKQKLKDELKDKNNGILLNRDAHYLFDDRLFEIDPRDGHVIIENNETSKKRVCQAFGISLDKSDCIYLKDSTLTEQMKEYIRQRN